MPSVVDIETTLAAWKERGFVGGVWVDPPGRSWERCLHHADQLVVLIEDSIKLLDDASNSLRRGRRPDKAHGDKLAAVLRFLADQLES